MVTMTLVLAEAAHPCAQAKQISLTPVGNVSALASREIRFGDLSAIARLLSEGFPNQRLAWFRDALASMSRMPEVNGLPRFGYMLVADAEPVGAVLTFGTEHEAANQSDRRLNVACWYVRPRYRAYGTILYQRLLAIKDVTCLNVTPAEHTWPVIEAQGFRRFADGSYIGLPLLGRASSDTRIVPSRASLEYILPEYERKLMEFHAAEGCVAFTCVTPSEVLPFVFRRRSLKRILPAAQLVYCRNLEDVGRCARAIGRHLARRGYLWMIVGANGPMQGVPGRYFPEKRPMYYKGPSKPRLGNLAYTELALLSP